MKSIIFSKRSLMLKPLHPWSRVFISWAIYKSIDIYVLSSISRSALSQQTGGPAHSLVLGCRRVTGMRKPHHIPE